MNRVTSNGKIYDVSDLVTLSELAVRLDTARTTPFQWAARYPDFPAPVIDRPRARFYSLTEVQEWLEQAGQSD